jgi:hypothetical protein
MAARIDRRGFFGSMAALAAVPTVASESESHYYRWKNPSKTTDPRWQSGRLPGGPHVKVYCNGRLVREKIFEMLTGRNGWAKFYRYENGSYVFSPCRTTIETGEVLGNIKLVVES